MRIAIIGLGLIGGSIGLALKRANWQQSEIVGYARRPELAFSATKLGAVDRAELNLKETVKEANLIIIATPVLTIKDILSQIASHLVPGAIVTDTASTKLEVMQWAKELLPPMVNFVGGHPMAGKETFGIEAAEANLFHNCIYCLTPGAKANPEAVQTVVKMTERIGATPFFIDAQTHDNLVAGISHLPFLLSAILVSVTTKSPSWEQMSKLAATGYRDLTRLASGNPKVNADVCLTNRAAILDWIDQFSKELDRFRRLIDAGNTELEEALARANEARQKWLQK